MLFQTKQAWVFKAMYQSAFSGQLYFKMYELLNMTAISHDFCPF